MPDERCELLEPPPRSFWFRARATLVSPLTPQEVENRLKAALPQMAVPPDAGRILVPIKRLYGGRVGGGRFRLSGPLGMHHVGAKLLVVGTIESHRSGSRIDLTAYPAGSLYALGLFWLLGLCIPPVWWFQEGAISAGPLAATLVFGVIGLAAYVANLGWGVFAVSVGTQLGYLVDHLTILFGRPAGPKIARPGRAASPRARPAAVPAADPTWAPRAVTGLVFCFGFGAFGLLVSCVGVPLVFLSPIWNEERLSERMVETRCVVLESRVVEKRSAVTKEERRGGRVEQVPTGEVRVRYKPEFLIRYEAAGQSYEIWTYGLPTQAGFSARADAERIVQQFPAGDEHPCWYDPLDPATAVLDRTTPGMWAMLPIVLIFGSCFFVPSVGVLVGGGILLRNLRKSHQ